MPARQSFEQSQLASQIGVGYGEAQVLTDRAALIEQQAARKEREGVRAAEAAKKAEKEKQAALKIDFPKDLAPAMQSALAREATKMYEELLTYYGTEGFDQKKQAMLGEFTGKIAQAKEYTRQFKDGVNTYADDRGTKNYNPDTDTDINLVMDSNIGDASWDDVSGWMDKANTDLSTSYTTKGYAGLAKEIMPIVNFSADKETVMFPGKDGNTYTRTTEEFSEDDAKNLIRQTISTSDTPNDWLQSGLAEMSDADKKTYGENINGIANYFADRFASDFTRDNIKTTYKEPKKDKDGDGYKQDLINDRARTIKKIQEGERDAFSMLVGGNAPKGGKITNVRFSTDEKGEGILRVAAAIKGQEVEDVIPVRDRNTINNIINSIADQESISYEDLGKSEKLEDISEVDYEKLNPAIDAVQKASGLENKKKALQDLFPGADIELSGLLNNAATITIDSVKYKIDDINDDESYNKLKETVFKEKSFRDNYLQEQEVPEGEEASRLKNKYL